LATVGATHQQYETDDGEQEQRRALQVGPHEPAMEPLAIDRETFASIRVVASDASANRGEVGSGVVDRHARLQPPHDLDELERASFQKLGRILQTHQRPHACWTRQLSIVGNDADKREWDAIQLHGMSDERLVGIKASSPETFAEDHGRRLVGGAECAPRDRRDAEHVEKAGCHGLPLDGFNAAIRSGDQRASAHPRLNRLQAIEAPGLAPDVLERGYGDWNARQGRAALDDGQQPIGFTERQRSQQRRIGQREDGAVGANAERQRRDGDERKSGRGSQLPNRKAHVLGQVAHPLRQVHFSVSLSGNGQTGTSDICDLVVAERPALASAHLDVQGELFIDLLLDRNAPQPRAKRTLHLASRILETPAVNSRQASVSAASCARPCRVRRYSFARRPSSDSPHSASSQPRRSIRYSAG
jgi:hypothetical protein